MTKPTINRRKLMLSTGSGVLSIPILTQQGLAQSGTDLQVDIRQIERPEFPNVSAFATVEDANGTVLTDLDASNFEIQEDGRTETVTQIEQPDSGSTTTVATSIVIDRSGSMTGPGRTRLEDAKAGANEFINNFGSGDQGQVIAFDSSNSIEIIERWTQDTTALTNAVDSITAGGSTALYDTVIKAVEEATERVGRSAVIVLADGQDNDSNNSIETAIDRANQENVPVYTIGLGDTLDPDALEQIATETGAEFYASADDGDLEGIYQSISESLNNEYEIKYQTTDDTTDANERTVELTATTGSDSGSDTDTYTEPCAPLPTAIFDVPDEVRVDESVSFDGNASKPNGGELVSYEWDFTNDGVTDDTGPTTTHTYTSVGNYETRLTVKKTCGAQDIATQPIFVFDDPIKIYITDTNAPVQAGETLEVQVDVENAGTDSPGLAVELFDFMGERVDVDVIRADRGTRTSIELDWETDIDNSGVNDIVVQVGDRKATKTVEITDISAFERHRAEKSDLAERLSPEGITASLDEREPVNLTLDELEKAVESDEITGSEAVERVERMIAAEEVTNATMTVTTTADPEENHPEYNLLQEIQEAAVLLVVTEALSSVVDQYVEPRIPVDENSLTELKDLFTIFTFGAKGEPTGPEGTVVDTASSKVNDIEDGLISDEEQGFDEIREELANNQFSELIQDHLEKNIQPELDSLNDTVTQLDEVFQRDITQSESLSESAREDVYKIASDTSSVLSEFSPVESIKQLIGVILDIISEISEDENEVDSQAVFIGTIIVLVKLIITAVKALKVIISALKTAGSVVSTISSIDKVLALLRGGGAIDELQITHNDAVRQIGATEAN